MRLQFDNPRAQAVRLRVVDLAGRVAREERRQLGAGSQQLELSLPAGGVYFAVLEAGATRSMAKFFVAD